MVSRIRRGLPFIVSILILLVVSACSSGDVSQEDYDALQIDPDGAGGRATSPDSVYRPKHHRPINGGQAY